LKRVAVLFPGRGSYTEKTLGILEAGHPLVRRAEALRAEYGMESLLDLDRASRLDQARHLRPANASALIWLAGLLDFERVAQADHAIAVGGNSLGWYTALAAAGVLAFEDGFRLMQEMALLQESMSSGGQVLYPRVGEDWRLDAERVRAVEAALQAYPGEVFLSIDLGGSVVFAGTEAGVAALLRDLPRVRLGANTYPFRLVKHGPYHTPLAAEIARRSSERFRGLDFGLPRLPLVDGSGRIHQPWSADAAELRRYTTETQVVEWYDFRTSVRVMLREFAPQELVLPGPGNSLGGTCGQILALEGWAGIRTKLDFDRVQSGTEAIVRSLHR
jgi:malonyl CoA-acyl carrier protein transacylase